MEDEPEGGPTSDGDCEDWAPVSFKDLLGDGCEIKRVDKDKKVLGSVRPEDMQREVETSAATQKRLGGLAEAIKDMNRQEKLDWALQVKELGNAKYVERQFDEAAKLYNDCLVALDLEGTEQECERTRQELQLPVCTNLAACMIESGQYRRCEEICDLALAVDPRCAKALFRRGLARYRLGSHARARADLEAASEAAQAQRSPGGEESAASRSTADIVRRAALYVAEIRRLEAREKASCRRMFETEGDGIYADRPGVVPEEDDTVVDDSDEAIEAALRRHDPVGWQCCCRRRPRSKVE